MVKLIDYFRVFAPSSQGHRHKIILAKRIWKYFQLFTLSIFVATVFALEFMCYFLFQNLFGFVQCLGAMQINMKLFQWFNKYIPY